MPFLSVHYSPGFQKDLTSWSMAIKSSGELTQTINVSRFSPLERRTETHDLSLSEEQMREINRKLEALDFAELHAAASDQVVDDTEQVVVKVERQGVTTQFSAPLDYWHWQTTRGMSLLPAQVHAIAFWHSLLTHSKYRRRAGDA